MSGPQKRREHWLSDVTHVPHTGRFRTRPQTAPRFPFLFYIPWPECQRVGGRQTRAPSGGDWEAKLGAITILIRRHPDFSSLCPPRPRSVAVMDNLAAPTVGVWIPPGRRLVHPTLFLHVLLVSLVPLLFIVHILLVSLGRKRLGKENTSSLRVIRVICEK